MKNEKEQQQQKRKQLGCNSLYFFYVAKKEGEQHQPKLLDQREQKTAFAKLKFLNNAKSFY